MSDDAIERLAVVETKVTHLEEGLQEIKDAIDEIKPLVWKAVGALAIVVFLVNMFLGKH